jgi:lipopolysaccharide transport system permease protein
LKQWFVELYRYRDLLWMWTLRDIKVRYKQSLLGAAWAVLQPLSLMLIFSIIFSYFVRVPTEGVPYPVFSYSALLPWTFFAASVSFAVPSLVLNMNLVTKIYFPREILPMSAVGASLVDFLVAWLVFIAMMLFYRIPLSVTLVLVPLLVVIQIVFTLGLVLLSSALNVFYRDIRFVVPVLVQLWMYLTPIIYPVSLVPENLRGLYMLNPMAGLIEAFRAVTLRGVWPQWEYLGLSTVVALVVFLAGYSYFKHVEWQFADLI